MKAVSCRWLGFGFLITFAVTTLLLTQSLNFKAPHNSHSTVAKPASSRQLSLSPAQKSGHKLAVLVPFRNRFEELMEFIPHIHSFLKNASVNHRILVINQADKLRFNRAALINIGYRLSVVDCDYLVMHDVDLLPANPALNYGYPDDHVFHLAAPHLHPLYHYKTFVGGILLLTHSDFQKVNGLSNRFASFCMLFTQGYVSSLHASHIVYVVDTGAGDERMMSFM